MKGLFSESVSRAAKPLPTMIPRCDHCGLYKGCQTPKMAPSGLGRKRILVVGDHPGYTEDERGEQFLGDSGRWLEKELRRVGISLRGDCVMTNAAICRGADRHRSAVVDCRPNLIRTLNEVNPVLVLLFGGSAVKSLIGHLWQTEDVGAVARWVNWQIPAHKPNCWVAPFHNPAYLLREANAALDGEFRRGLEAAVARTDRPWPDGPPDYSRYVELIYDPIEAADRIRSYKDGVIAFDFETTCLKPDGPAADIVCCSVCWNGEETIVFPWHGEAVAAMKELLEDDAVSKIGANSKFEHRWTFRKLGINVRGWVWDTVLAAHSLDSRRGVTGVKFQSFVRLGVPDYAAAVKRFLESDRKGGNEPNRIGEISVEQLWRYCGLDSLLEYEVAQDQMREMGLST